MYILCDNGASKFPIVRTITWEFSGLIIKLFSLHALFILFLLIMHAKYC